MEVLEASDLQDEIGEDRNKRKDLNELRILLPQQESYTKKTYKTERRYHRSVDGCDEEARTRREAEELELQVDLEQICELKDLRNTTQVLASEEHEEPTSQEQRRSGEEETVR